MPNYTLVISKEQENLNHIREALRCFASHLWVSKDSAGHVWPFANCDSCSEADFCRRIKLTVEKEMN